MSSGASTHRYIQLSLSLSRTYIHSFSVPASRLFRSQLIHDLQRTYTFFHSGLVARCITDSGLVDGARTA